MFCLKKKFRTIFLKKKRNWNKFYTFYESSLWGKVPKNYLKKNELISLWEKEKNVVDLFVFFSFKQKRS